MQLSSDLSFPQNLSCSFPDVVLVLTFTGLLVLHAPQVEAWVLQALLLIHMPGGLVELLNDKVGPGQPLTQIWYSECAVLRWQNAGRKSDNTWRIMLVCFGVFGQQIFHFLHFSKRFGLETACPQCC